MAGVSGAKLAFETCRAGGLGFIAAGHLNSKEAFKELEHEIETFKELAASASESKRENYPLCIGFIGHSTFKEELGWNLVQHLLEDYEPDGKKGCCMYVGFVKHEYFTDLLSCFACLSSESDPILCSSRLVPTTWCQGENTRLEHSQALPIVWMQGSRTSWIGQRRD